MPAASAVDWGIRSLPGARDKIRSREPRRTITVIESFTRYMGIGVAVFMVGSGISRRDDAYRSGGDPYFVCCGTRKRPAFRKTMVSERTPCPTNDCQTKQHLCVLELVEEKIASKPRCSATWSPKERVRRDHPWRAIRTMHHRFGATQARRRGGHKSKPAYCDRGPNQGHPKKKRSIQYVKSITL